MGSCRLKRKALPASEVVAGGEVIGSSTGVGQKLLLLGQGRQCRQPGQHGRQYAEDFCAAFTTFPLLPTKRDAKKRTEVDQKKP